MFDVTAVIEMKNPQTHAALGIYHEINIALLTVQHLQVSELMCYMSYWLTDGKSW